MGFCYISKNSAVLLFWYLKAFIGTAILGHQDNYSGCGLPRNRNCFIFQSSDLIFQSLIDKSRDGSRNSLRGGGFWARILRRGGLGSRSVGNFIY